MTNIAITSFAVVDNESTTLKSINSIGFPPDILPPKKRFMGLYGTRSTLNLLSTIRQKAIREQKTVFRIDLKVDGGDKTNLKIDNDSIFETNFLNLNRLTMNFENTLMSKVRLKKPEIFQGKKSLSDMILTSPTDFFDVIWGIKECQHINIIAFETTAYYNKIISFGVLRDQSVVNSIAIRGYEKELPTIMLYE